MLGRDAVFAKETLQTGPDPIAFHAVHKVVEPDNQRRLGEDAPFAVDLLRKLRERVHVIPGHGLGDNFVEMLAHLLP